MAILLTAGTGKTAQSIIPHLRSASIPFLLTSRRPESAPAGTHAAYFDWLDPSTYDSPFTHPFLGDQKITAIYLIAPDVEDPVNIATGFIDRAAEKWGVKRYVLMCGSLVEMGSPGGDVGMPGMIWKHVVEKGYEWAVLRCTWFMENFLGKEYAPAIKDVGKIYSACGDGKIPFVSAKDVGAVAFRALTDAEAWNKDVRVLGPDLLTLDNLAVKFSKALSKPVTHVKMSKADIVVMYKEAGLPEPVAELVATMEDITSQGVEERMNDVVEKVTGQKPKRFDDMIGENLGVWQ